MTTLYVDFDGTITESHRAIIQLLNNKYGTNKSESDLKDWGYHSIAPTNKIEILNLYECEDFWNILKFKPSCEECLNRLAKNNKIVVVSKGTQSNLEKKKDWLDKHLNIEFEFVGLENNECLNTKSLSKKVINMKGGVQIDDVLDALDTSAMIKILYKDYKDYSWQHSCENSEVLITNTWEEIENIVNFFSEFDYKTLERKD